MAAALLPPSVRRLGLSRAVHEALFQHADAADLAAADIAVAEVARRLEADADDGGRGRGWYLWWAEGKGACLKRFFRSQASAWACRARVRGRFATRPMRRMSQRRTAGWPR